MNNLRKKGGSIADLSKALVRKWKDLVSINDSPNKKNSSPLNTLSSDFKPDELLTSHQSDVCLENFSKNHTREKLVNSTVMLENKEHKKQKVRRTSVVGTIRVSTLVSLRVSMSVPFLQLLPY